MDVGFIGLGSQGGPMARRIVEAGFPTTLWARRPASLEPFADTAAKVAGSPAELAAASDLVCLCVVGDADVEEVVTGDNGILAGLKPGGVIAIHSTVHPKTCHELAERAAAQAVSVIDAPVSGGAPAVAEGRLLVMVGGDEEDFRNAKPLIESYARAVNLIGPAGSGQLTKMVNQICIGGLIEALAEALHFAKAAKLDVAKVIDTISKGAAQSWQMENRWKTMIEGKFDFGFAVDWVRKDFAMCFEEARRNGARLPVTAIVDQFYADIQEMGGGRWDTSSLIALLEHRR